MRERLLAALVLLTVAVIVLNTVPRAYFLADLIESQESRKVERSADLMAVLIQERASHEEPVTSESLEPLLHEGEFVSYVSAGGDQVSAGVEPDASAAIVASRPLSGGGELAVERSRTVVQDRVSEALLPLVLTGVGLVVLSVIVAFGLANRLSRPFRELAVAATQMGSGNLDALVIGRYSVPEAEGIGLALRASAHRLSDLLRREREFAVNAAHQLRTPITALRLGLEDISRWPETPEAVTAELTQNLSELDRLSEAINDFLLLTRGVLEINKVDVDLANLVKRVVDRWERPLRDLGRRIECRGGGHVSAWVEPGAVEQILDVLIENAAKHGAGEVTVSAGEGTEYVFIRVADEGRNRLGPRVFHRGKSGSGSTGVGLSIAQEFASLLGGRIEIGRGESTSFELLLSKSVD